MHGLQACLFKYITVAAFRFYLSKVKMPLKGEVGVRALKSLFQNACMVYKHAYLNTIMLLHSIFISAR